MYFYKKYLIFYIVLPIIMAAQSFFCQTLAGISENYINLAIINISLSLTAISILNNFLLRLLICAQALFSIFCASYIKSIGTPPTLNAIINGKNQLAGIDLKSLSSYIDINSLLIFSTFLLIQLYLCNYRTVKYRKYIFLPSLVLFLIMQIDACAKQDPNVFSPEVKITKAKKGIFTSPVKKSIEYRGYTATFIVDYLYSDYTTPPLCTKGDIDSIPILQISDKIIFIQVECLDFELLEQKVDENFVMPFLNSLLSKSILLRLDGTKKLASANSDFEIFNGREAQSDVVHYEYEASYPHSLIALLVRSGLTAEVFHGLPADYMNLNTAYKLQGFSRYHDLETIKQSGIKPINCWWAGIISDKDLFDYAASRIPESQFIHFIITMTMHLPEHIDLITDKILFPSSKKSRFLTLAHDTDAAIKKYIERLPDGTVIFLWGDHKSYTNNNSGKIPFIAYKKGENNHFDGRKISTLTRCNMYFYLKKTIYNNLK